MSFPIISLKMNSEINFVNKKFKIIFDKFIQRNKPKKKLASRNLFSKFVNNDDPSLTLYSTVISILKLKSRSYSKKFINLGIFKLHNSFYDVFFRKTFLNTNKNYAYIDIILNDITILRSIEKTKAESNLKTVMFGKMADEFKTPLITITSELDNLEEKILNKEEKSVILTICSNIKHLSHYTVYLIHDIINYSNTDGKKMNIFKKNINNINTWINFSVNVLHSLLNYFTGEKRLIKTVIDIDEAIKNYYLITDEMRLNQILLNLLSNAVKFISYGCITLRVFLSQNKSNIHSNTENINKENDLLSPLIYYKNPHSRSNSNYLDVYKKELIIGEDIIIEISNTSIGISPDLVNLINSDEEMNKIEIENYNNSHGSGLGIGISKQLCSALGIILECKSDQETKLTTFTLIINSYKKTREDELVNNEEVPIASYSSSFDSNENIITDSDRTKKLNISYFNQEEVTSEVTNEEDAQIKSKIHSKNHRFKKQHDGMSSNRTNTSIKKISLDIHKKVIIICDDSSIILDSLMRLFNNFPKVLHNYDIIKLTDGVFILESVVNLQQKGFMIELVISDENMEYMNGSYARKIIGNMQERNKLSTDIKFVSLTAFEDTETREMLISCGFNKVLLNQLIR